MNVVVPDYGVGSTNKAPDIFSGVSFTASDGRVINNTASGPALARNIDMQGSTQAQRSILRLRAGRLRVFGSFSNLFDSYIQDLGTVAEFASTGNQTITGGSFTVIEFSGGGTKNLLGVMRVSLSMTFLPNGGLLTTDISQPDNNFVDLG
ncbi:hypothetical protein GRW34_22590, partial [Escherichia coli]|nr:hypothetical protein [Escherichia coli]